MARTFVAASSQYLETATLPVAATPFTIAAWVKPTNNTTTYSVVSLADAGSITRYFNLAVNGAAAGDPISFVARNGSGAYIANTSTGYTAGAWNHACAVAASDVDRRVFLNGAGKGTETTSVVPSSLDRMGIGVFDGSTRSAHLDGSLAEVALWDIALADEDVARLATGISPLMVHPEALVFYAPILGRADPEIDLIGGLGVTVVGATVADHPRIVRPRGRSLIVVPTAAGGSTLTCDAGSYTVTGYDATLTRARLLTCDAGSYTVTGLDATLTAARLLVADAGSYTLTGGDPTLTKGVQLVADAGGYTVTGFDPTLTWARQLAADAGSYAQTGLDATLQKSAAGDLVCAAGAYTLTGYDATLTWARVLNTDAVAYTVTGYDITLTAGQALVCDAGSYTVTGFDATFIYAHVLACDAGSYSLTGHAAILTYSGATIDVADDAHTWQLARRDSVWQLPRRDTTWRM